MFSRVLLDKYGIHFSFKVSVAFQPFAPRLKTKQVFFSEAFANFEASLSKENVWGLCQTYTSSVFIFSLLSSVNKRHEMIKGDNVFDCCSALSLTLTAAPGTQSLG